ETCSFKRGAVTMHGYPALVDEQNQVALRVLDNPLDARVASRRGVVRLGILHQAHTAKYLQKSLLKNKDMGLTVVDLGRRELVVDDMVMAAVNKACFEGEPLPRTEADFARCLH